MDHIEPHSCKEHDACLASRTKLCCHVQQNLHMGRQPVSVSRFSKQYDRSTFDEQSRALTHRQQQARYKRCLQRFSDPLGSVSALLGCIVWAGISLSFGAMPGKHEIDIYVHCRSLMRDRNELRSWRHPATYRRQFLEKRPPISIRHSSLNESSRALEFFLTRSFVVVDDICGVENFSDLWKLSTTPVNHRRTRSTHR
jgi:hypothetical protein